MNRLLHVGCGSSNITDLKGFNSSWKEDRLDINPDVNPDIIADITDLGCVPSNEYDAVYSSHNIEHVYAHQVEAVLKDFYRVLTPKGFLIITCPDLESVCEQVIQKGLVEPLYDSAAGPISAIDILYGHRQSIANGNTFMSHKCGFTFQVIANCLEHSGFKSIFGGKRPAHFDLWMLAFKNETHISDVQNIANKFLPN